MIGRATEASFVEDLVAAARAGRSGAVLISGDPGIGKTVLLAHARASAGGARVLEAVGSEAESHLAFAGLSDLLAPILPLIDALPDPQADALRGALAFGPPVPGDRFTAYVATLSLLAAAAEEGPVVCILDDAHWLDSESFEAVQFAAGRLEAEGVAMLLAAREGVNPLTDASALPRLRLEGLSAADAGRLLGRHATVAVAPRVVDALVAGAAGNPLALIELAGSLSAAQLQGSEPLPDPLPAGPYLERALLRPLERLPAETRRALVIASADDGSIELLERALAVDGLGLADLEAAAEAGMVVVGAARVDFSHPMVRSAVYQGAQAPDRRAAHRAYAEAAAARDDTEALDRSAWHMALAATGPDEDVAAALEQAAARAGARTAYAAATVALESAARLSPDAIARGRRLGMAGQSALTGGSPAHAAVLFDEVIALAADPGQAVDAMVGRGFSEMMNGSGRRAAAMLVGVADRIEAMAPPAAAILLAQATLCSQMQMDARGANELTERARALAADAPVEVRSVVAVAVATAATMAGRPATVSAETEAQLMRQAAAGDQIAPFWVVSVLYLLMLDERYAEAIERTDAFVQAARAMSTPSGLPFVLSLRAELLTRVGRLVEARASAAEAVRIAEETGQAGVRGYAMAILAGIEAIAGLSAECHAHAAAAVANLEVSESKSLPVFAQAALGLEALGAGRLDEALSHLAATHRLHAADGNAHPLILPFLQDLVETSIRLGDLSSADERLTELEQQARTTGAAWPAAAAARCRGLLASEAEFEEHFARALELHERTPTPFERGRTLLCLGERRRRARRVREAREPLAAALEIFETIDAAPWAEWARRELQAAGAEAPVARPAAAGLLTPQELQVALTVAHGATNREAATALLISAKTVEHHLARVYSKLGVHTRTQLAARLAGDPTPR